jgi:hypothetical protein
MVLPKATEDDLPFGLERAFSPGDLTGLDIALDSDRIVVSFPIFPTTELLCTGASSAFSMGSEIAKLRFLNGDRVSSSSMRLAAGGMAEARERAIALPRVPNSSAFSFSLSSTFTADIDRDITASRASGLSASGHTARLPSSISRSTSVPHSSMR